MKEDFYEKLFWEGTKVVFWTDLDESSHCQDFGKFLKSFNFFIFFTFYLLQNEKESKNFLMYVTFMPFLMLKMMFETCLTSKIPVFVHKISFYKKSKWKKSGFRFFFLNRFGRTPPPLGGQSVYWTIFSFWLSLKAKE